MNNSVKCIPFPDIKNAYVVISAGESTKPNNVEKCMSFFYVEGDIGVEWEPDYGPITVIYKCLEDDPNAQMHWFFDYCTGYGNWSQLAVLEQGLDVAFLSGNYEMLFGILKDWRS